LLISQFLECVPGDVARQLRLAHAMQPLNVMEMARMCRQLVSTSVSSLTEDSRTAPMEKRIAELEEKVAAVRIRAERGSRCFQCGEVRINGRVLVCLVDTGAAISLIDVGLCREIRACSLAVQTVSGHALKILGVSNCCVEVGDRVVRYPFVVTKDIQQTILGADFLREVEAVIDTKNKTVNTKYGHFSIHENSQIAKTQAAILPQVNIENINKVIAKYGSLFTDDGEAYGYCDKVTHEIPVNSPLTEAVDDKPMQFSREVKTLLSQKDRLRLNAAGVLTWKDNDGSWIPVIPKPLRHELISECHQLAHTGVARTTDLLRQSAYWPGMQEDVMRY
ncbi:Gap-Pol polyprotein, partial [Schistosoma japonicum]